MNLFTKEKQTHRLRGWIYGCQRGRMGGRNSYQVWNWQVHTPIFKMDHQQGPAIQQRERCSMLCRSLDGRGVWGRTDTCICMAETLPCSLEIITTLFISSTSKQNKKVCFFLIVLERTAWKERSRTKLWGKTAHGRGKEETPHKRVLGAAETYFCPGCRSSALAFWEVRIKFSHNTMLTGKKQQGYY